jgi:hypothetical protein
VVAGDAVAIRQQSTDGRGQPSIPGQQDNLTFHDHPPGPSPGRIATNGPMQPITAPRQHTSIFASGKSRRRLQKESDESGRHGPRVQFARARGEPGEALPGQAGQLGRVQRPALPRPRVNDPGHNM